MNETWDRLKVEIVVPQAATNLVTNPSVETNDTGYTLVGASVTKERVATYQRRGAYSLKITPVDSVESGVYFGDIAVTSGEQYSVSVDIFAPDGENFYLKVLNTSSTSRGSTTFAGIGYWKRESLTFTAAATESVRLYIARLDSETSTDPFYIDGLQFENNSEPTTYFDGDFVGFVPTRNDFGWNGTRHASTSYRTGKTKAGGSLVNLADYATIINVLGLGMGQFSQSYSDLNTGGALYEKHTRNTTPFSIILQFSGNNHGEMAAKRAAVINAVRPDNADDQPMIVRVTAIDDTVGYVAGQPVDIPCMLLPSLTDTPQLPSSQRTALQFRALDGVFPGAFHEGAQLDFADSLTNANYILMRDTDGQWQEMGTGADTGGVIDTIIGPDGLLYICGSFTSVNSVSNTNLIAKWDGSNFSALGNPAAGSALLSSAHAMKFDSSGNLYIVGAFNNFADVADADFVAMWDGSSWNAVGAPAVTSTTRSAICIAENGYIYVGGNFDNLAGDADADNVAMWDGSSWNALDTGLNNVVWCIKQGPDGYIYIGGQFTSADGVDGDYICYWDGTAFNRIGTTELNGTVYDILFDSSGNLIATGAFTNAGGNSEANYIALWNGASWENLGGGLNGAGYKLLILNDGSIVVGGAFTISGDLAVLDRVAQYKNGSWSALNIDLPGSDNVYALAKSVTGNLYVGGAYSGTALVAGNTTVTNNSGANAYPIIELDGPGLVHQLKNTDTNCQITFDGLTLLTGETLTINFEPDNLTVESSFRGNCLNYIAEGSDPANFYIKPGTNNISLLMTGTDSDTNAVIYYSPKYWSIDQTKYGV